MIDNVVEVEHLLLQKLNPDHINKIKANSGNAKKIAKKSLNDKHIHTKISPNGKTVCNALRDLVPFV